MEKELQQIRDEAEIYSDIWRISQAYKDGALSLLGKLESKIKKLETALEEIATGAQPYNEREAFSFVDTARSIAIRALQDSEI